MKRTAARIAILGALLPFLLAADWPVYRGDAGRTGLVDQSLPEELQLSWVHHASQLPMAAWPDSPRMQFDRALQVVSDGDRVFFGSSSDGAVYALDVKSGDVLWRFYTEGPIRFAPAIWRDRLLVASDDGHLYALATGDGNLLWKVRGGPGNQRVIGNQRMVSKWPARGGPVIVDDVVYFAAGIWPSDGIYLYAVNAETGQVMWCNSDSGGLYMPQPHGGANARSGVSAQGYLVISGDHLIVPTGRAVPASFDRHTGEFEYFHLQKYGHNGEAPTMAIGDVFFNSGLSFALQGGEKIASVGTGKLAASPDGVVRAFNGQVGEYRWHEEEKPGRKGTPVRTKSLQPQWMLENIPNAAEVAVAADKIILGCDGEVVMVNCPKREVVWRADIEGIGYGLAVVENSLLVSTDQGMVYCFSQVSNQTPHTTSPPRHDDVGPVDQLYVTAASEILQHCGLTSGYCVDLACGDGSLALQLAQTTELQILAVDEDPENVRRARARLSAAGVYGQQVQVHLLDPSATDYPRYFANLVVSGKSVTEGHQALARVEAERLQRPFGGVICVGMPGEMQVEIRGELAGAGSWTHQYADPANTLTSEDELVRGRLSILWYRDVDFDVPSRHGRAPSPLVHQGRIFHEGLNGIIAVDAYNGHELWRYDIPDVLKAYDGDELMGVAGTGSNFCVGDGSVFVRDGKRCLQLDAGTGTLLAEYQTPVDDNGQPGTWGYIAFLEGILFGSRAIDEHTVTYRYVNRGGDMSKLLTESSELFALDVETGDTLWRYRSQDAIRHNAIAIAQDRVFLIDRPLAMFDREKKPETREHPTGRLVALDLRTGRLLWTHDDDVFGTLLAASNQHKVLLMSYQPTRFQLDSEVGGRLAAFAMQDGKQMWDREAKYASRPLINDQTIYAQGGAWDLLSGSPVRFDFERSYGCGILAGSKNMLVYRSATLGYCDLKQETQTENFGGMRPGCWINALPAGGLVLVPDASSGCQCSYLNKAWVALEPVADGDERQEGASTGR
jgi:outer membrane protein assembly factor BamB